MRQNRINLRVPFYQTRLSHFLKYNELDFEKRTLKKRTQFNSFSRLSLQQFTSQKTISYSKNHLHQLFLELLYFTMSRQLINGWNDGRPFSKGTSEISRSNRLEDKKLYLSRRKAFKTTVTSETSLVLSVKTIRAPSHQDPWRSTVGKLLFNRQGTQVGVKKGMTFGTDRFSAGRLGFILTLRDGSYTVIRPPKKQRRLRPQHPPSFVTDTLWPGHFSPLGMCLHVIESGLRVGYENSRFYLELQLVIGKWGLKNIIGFIDPERNTELTPEQSEYICFFLKNSKLQFDPLCVEMLKEEIAKDKTNVLRDCFVKYQERPTLQAESEGTQVGVKNETAVKPPPLKIYMKEETTLEAFFQPGVVFRASGDTSARMRAFFQVFRKSWPTDKQRREYERLHVLNVWPTAAQIEVAKHSGVSNRPSSVLKASVLLVKEPKTELEKFWYDAPRSINPYSNVHFLSSHWNPDIPTDAMTVCGSGYMTPRETQFFVLEIARRLGEETGLLVLKVVFRKHGLKMIIGLIDPDSYGKLTDTQAHYICMFFKLVSVQSDKVCLDMLKSEAARGKLRASVRGKKSDALRLCFVEYAVDLKSGKEHEKSMCDVTDIDEFSNEQVGFQTSGDAIGRLKAFFDVFRSLWPTKAESAQYRKLKVKDIWPSEQDMPNNYPGCPYSP